MSNISRSKTRVTGFNDPEMDFQLIRQLGVCSASASSIGECLYLASQIDDGQPDTWVKHFEDLAIRQEQDAKHRLSKNHPISAKKLFYKACNSFRAAEYYTPCSSAKHRELGMASKRCFLAAIDLQGYYFKQFEIPFKSISLPCYLFSNQVKLADKTLIIVSGFDGTLEEEFFFRGLDALERGYNVLLMAGPGQMDVFRMHPDTYFEPDYESPVSTVLDYLQKNLNHSFNHLSLMGISFGGYFATRAAIYEPRIKALIANSPIVNLYDYLATFTQMDPCNDIPDEEDFTISDLPHIPDAEMSQQLKAQTEQLMFRFGKRSFKNTFKYMKAFNVRDELSKLSIPSLSLCGEGEGSEPLNQFNEFIAATGSDSFLFTLEQGADSHCQVGNADFANAIVYDWLDELYI